MAAKKESKATPTPMDPGAKETTTPVESTNHPRVCYALRTLIEELKEVFPEIGIEVSGYTPGNVALDATIDLGTLADDEEATMFGELLLALQSDPRIHEVILEGRVQGFVSIWPSLRVRDNTDPFGVKETWGILSPFGGSL